MNVIMICANVNSLMYINELGRIQLSPCHSSDEQIRTMKLRRSRFERVAHAECDLMAQRLARRAEGPEFLGSSLT